MDTPVNPLGRSWDMLAYPIPEREPKPRNKGLTMVIDKGLGLAATRDLLDCMGDSIDLVKLGFGTALMYPEGLLQRKIALIREAGVDVYPGGTLLEIAFLQGQSRRFLSRCKELGFSCMEVSEGTIDLTQAERESLISEALKQGFMVLTEVGKKDPLKSPSTRKMQEQIARDLEMGVFKVIIEARDSGKGVGIFDQGGKVIWEKLANLMEGAWTLKDLFIEAPLPSQQINLILKFGPHVNLGNVQPENVMSLECLRRGLRSDTLQGIIGGQ